MNPFFAIAGLSSSLTGLRCFRGGESRRGFSSHAGGRGEFSRSPTTRSPQPPAPFALTFEAREGYVLVRPAPSDTDFWRGVHRGLLP